MAWKLKIGGEEDEENPNEGGNQGEMKLEEKEHQGQGKKGGCCGGK